MPGKGRIKESVYKRSVQKQLHKDKNRILPIASRTIVVEGWTLAAERVVAAMVNTFAAERSFPSMITVSLVMPEGTDEPQLRTFSAQLGRLCADRHIEVDVPDVRILPGAGVPVFTATGLAGDYDIKPMGRLAADMYVVAAGTIACEGAAILALEKEEELKERFAGFFLEEAQGLFDAASMPGVRDILTDLDISGIAVREGGIFAGLWELGTLGKVGLDIDLRAIPVRQHTIEICEHCNRNPYMLLSGGCILLATYKGEATVLALSREGIPAAVIGRTTSSNDRIIRYDEEIRFLEPPKTDEIYQFNRNRRLPLPGEES